jgi:hypothetical protein
VEVWGGCAVGVGWIEWAVGEERLAGGLFDDDFVVAEEMVDLVTFF